MRSGRMPTKEELIHFEDAVRVLWEQGKINKPIHFSGGNEDELIKIFKLVQRKDYVFSTWRSHYHYLLHGGRADELLDKIVLSRGGSMHITNPKLRFYSSATVGATASIACGVALGLKLAGKKEHVWCFVGDGATDQGWFWEAQRYASGWDLPVTFVVENNNRSVETDLRSRWGEYQSEWKMLTSDKIRYYRYEPTYPHVGTGKHITFL